MKNTWQFLNSPLVVVLLAFALWPFVSAWEHRLAVRATFKAAFAELNRAEKEMNDQAKESGIKKLVESFASQFIDGFTTAFDNAGEGQSVKLAKFSAAQAKITLNEVKIVPSSFSSREKIVGVIHNGYDAPVSDLKLNLTMFAADGQLLDVADESLHDIKMIQPGQDVGFTVDHDLDSSNQDKNAMNARRAAKVTAQVVSLDIVEPPKPK